MNQRFNFLKGTIVDAINSSATEITVDSDITPDLDSGNYFYIVLDYNSKFGDPEIVKVTTVDGDTFTVERGQYNTIARSHVANTVWGHGVLAEDLQEETEARENADEGLQDQFDDFETSVQDSLDSLNDADGDLDTAIDNEIQDRTDADDALNTAISDEITARSNADTALGDRIDDETQERINADGALDSRLDTVEDTLPDKADLVAGTVPANQLPAYVDDVLEYADLAAFPVTGEANKIYVAIDTNNTYRWSGSTYVIVGSSLALGETSGTAYRGDRGKTAYDHSQVTGNPHGATAAQVGADPAGSATTAQAAAISAAALDATAKADAKVVQTITNGVTATAPSQDAVFDALAGKSDTGHNHAGVYDLAGTADAKVADAINDGITTVAPSQNAVFDALGNKVPTSRTVNGHALSADVTVTKSDVSLGNADNTSDATKNSATATLTNKRITKRVTTITSSATPTINTDNCDAVTITALATAITSMTSGLSGAPSNFDSLIFRIKDDGTARAITWGASFASRGATLPTTTTLGKVTTVGFFYNSVALVWDCVACVVEL